MCVTLLHMYIEGCRDTSYNHSISSNNNSTNSNISIASPFLLPLLLDDCSFCFCYCHCFYYYQWCCCSCISCYTAACSCYCCYSFLLWLFGGSGGVSCCMKIKTSRTLIWFECTTYCCLTKLYTNYIQLPEQYFFLSSTTSCIVYHKKTNYYSSCTSSNNDHFSRWSKSNITYYLHYHRNCSYAAVDIQHSINHLSSKKVHKIRASHLAQ